MPQRGESLSQPPGQLGKVPARQLENGTPAPAGSKPASPRPRLVGP